MINELLNGFYHLDLPYPRHPLRNINVYLVKGKERSILIDTGIDIEETHKTLMDDLKKLGVSPEKLDFSLTHGHRDHFGGLSLIAREGATLYMTRTDVATMIETPGMWQTRINAAPRHGFPESVVRAAMANPPYSPQFTDNHRFHYLKENDILNVGNLEFRCIETPGHSKGHMCLYEPESKVLVTGDHVLTDVSPNVSCWSDNEDPLSNYLTSLDKVYKLDVRQVLPAHRRLFSDLKARVNELKEHHKIRAEEAVNILRKKGPLNAYHIALLMTWDIPYPWEQIPVWQKFSAVGETIAHLNYLITHGRVSRKVGAKETVFSLKAS